MSRRREAARGAVGGVEEAEDADALGGGRVELVAGDLGHLEELLEAGEEALAARRVGGEAGEQPVGGEDGEAGVVEPGERHQRVVLRALAADLVAVGAGGLVAVVAVGDQQLGAREALDHGGDDRGVGDPPDPVDGAVVVGRPRPRARRRGRARPAARGPRSRARRSARGSGGWRGSVRAGRAAGRGGCARGGGRRRSRSPRPGPGRARRGGCGWCRRGRRSPGRAPRPPPRRRRPARPRRATRRSAAPRPRRDRRPAALAGSAGSNGTGRSIATALYGERSSSRARPAASITS